MLMVLEEGRDSAVTVITTNLFWKLGEIDIFEENCRECAISTLRQVPSHNCCQAIIVSLNTLEQNKMENEDGINIVN